ncbi:MAG: CPBP family intramembrane metalloprotease [Deltaproteobacteria bacterium]|nr:MAG: CPBP family intramembrane metalloprotease [Deltaproteobacteria bacterium]
MTPMDSPHWDRTRLGAVVGFYAVLSVAAVLWHAVGQESLDPWHVAPRPWSVRVQGALAGLALGGATVVGFRRLYPTWRWLRTLHREVRALLGTPTRTEILILAACSAVGEELFFRGAMMDAWGVGASTIVFALLHVPPRASLWPWTASAFCFGLAFAGLAQWSGSLTGPVLAHFVVNWRNLTFICTRAPEDGPPADASETPRA